MEALCLFVIASAHGAADSVDKDSGHAYPSFGIRNPLIEHRADPWCTRHTDGYYFTSTVPEYDRIELRRACTIASHQRVVKGVADAIVDRAGPIVIAGAALGDPEGPAGILDLIPEPAGRRGRYFSSDAVLVAVSGKDVEGRQCLRIIFDGFDVGTCAAFIHVAGHRFGPEDFHVLITSSVQHLAEHNQYGDVVVS